MVSVRIFASAQRVISLRLRPLRATDELLEQLARAKGRKPPPNSSCIWRST
jgi:zinc transporter